MRFRQFFGKSGAFTLIELLLTIAIIGLLISLLLPALNRGHHKVRQIRCTSNLHQAGLGFLSFAHGHDDKFPIQVSTNNGGSSEFVEAGNAVQGHYFFSYKHFLPLASELQDPKILVCPTDFRTAATNFASLNNSNLSYFTALSPVFGNSDSVLAGDRNLQPVSNTVARLSPRRPLRWTGEMHQYRGNVLFADGHVSQLNDFFSLSNYPGAGLTSLVLPDVPVVASASGQPAMTSGGGGGGGAGGGSGGTTPGGNLRATFAAKNSDAVLTNGAPLTNIQITSGPRNTPRSAFVIPGPGGGNNQLPIPEMPAPPASNNPLTKTTITTPDSTAEQAVQEAHADLVQTGRQLAGKGARTAYFAPWWIIVLLLISALWLLKRVHERNASRSKPPSSDTASPYSTKA